MLPSESLSQGFLLRGGLYSQGTLFSVARNEWVPLRVHDIVYFSAEEESDASFSVAKMVVPSKGGVEGAEGEGSWRALSVGNIFPLP